MQKKIKITFLFDKKNNYKKKYFKCFKNNKQYIFNNTYNYKNIKKCDILFTNVYNDNKESEKFYNGYQFVIDQIQVPFYVSSVSTFNRNFLNFQYTTNDIELQKLDSTIIF